MDSRWVDLLNQVLAVGVIRLVVSVALRREGEATTPSGKVSEALGL